MARKPKNVEHGKHSFQGLRYDRNGNPLYTSNTLSNDEAKEMGWKFSKKHGLYGQINDPTKFYESKKQVIRLTESDLHNIIKESVNKMLKEDVDMGQILSSQERNDKYGETPMLYNVRSAIGKLRTLIYCYDEINALSKNDILDVNIIYNEINKLKKLL